MTRPRSKNLKDLDARAFIIIEEEYKNCTFRLNVLNFEDYTHKGSTEVKAVLTACRFFSNFLDEDTEDTEETEDENADNS